jgi:uncharacterized membrane protein YtjA (UPF0391 family)
MNGLQSSWWHFDGNFFALGQQKFIRLLTCLLSVATSSHMRCHLVKLICQAMGFTSIRETQATTTAEKVMFFLILFHFHWFFYNCLFSMIRMMFAFHLKWNVICHIAGAHGWMRSCKELSLGKTGSLVLFVGSHSLSHVLNRKKGTWIPMKDHSGEACQSDAFGEQLLMMKTYFVKVHRERLHEIICFCALCKETSG